MTAESANGREEGEGRGGSVRVIASTRGELRTVREARGAGGGAGGGERGSGARGPSPCPAAGWYREPPDFQRPGGICGRCSGSLQVTGGAAPAGPSAAERRGASGVGCGADAGSFLTAAAPRAPRSGPGRAAALLEELAPGPGLWPGPGSPGWRAPSPCARV